MSELWPLYVFIFLTFVLLYFILRLEWVYRKCEELLKGMSVREFREQYPAWERILWRYFYIWRFKSLKGKK